MQDESGNYERKKGTLQEEFIKVKKYFFALIIYLFIINI